MITTPPAQGSPAPATRARSGEPTDAPGAEQGLRVVLYSHDSVGLGHTRRNLAIARALSRILPERTGRRVSGLLITGERAATSFPCPPGFDWVVLPGICKENRQYAPRTLNVGTRRLMDIRSSVIEGALTTFRPHICIVDRHPFGADGELVRPLAALREVKPDSTVVLGLREVLDGPEVARREWAQVGLDRVREAIDEIWVYGDRAVHDPIASGEIPTELADRTLFTGLLADGRTMTGAVPQADRPYVLTMVGGGSDGEALASAAAAATLPSGVRHLVVTGPQMDPAARSRVFAHAGPGVDVLPEVPDGLACITGAQAVLTMGGYNTITEILSTDSPALVVPRVRPRAEQLIRAQGLASVGALDMLHPDHLSAESVSAWLRSALTDRALGRRQHTARARLGTAGLARVGELAARIASLTDRRPAAAGTMHSEDSHVARR